MNIDYQVVVGQNHICVIYNIDSWFETFRDTCSNYYHLDPAHVFTSPVFAWQAALKMTHIKLDCFTDLDMHSFIEQVEQGGVATVTHSYAKANIPYLDI